MPMHPPGRNYTQTLKEDREAILLADRLGFTEAFIGEHISDHCESIPSCLSFIASLAHATKNIRLGSGTVNLPNHHPAEIAAHVAMIDHLFWNISTARTLMADTGQGVFVRPYQQPHPPIVVTASSPGAKGLMQATARGWGPISANFLQPGGVATHWPGIAAGQRLAGKQPDWRTWRVAKSIFVADDEATAQRYGRDVNGAYGFYFWNILAKRTSANQRGTFKRDPAMSDDAVTVEYLLDTLVIAGTVNRVVDELLQLRETIGPFGTLLYCGHDWVDPALSRRSMELMAHEVMPRLNRALGE